MKYSYFIAFTYHKDGLKVKSVQSALSDLKRPPEFYSPSAIIGLSLFNSILMARFLKQSFAQTCLKETDNGKLQQFNYSRSLITNRTGERSREELAALQRILYPLYKAFYTLYTV